MKKAKKAANERKQKRPRTDWGLFLRLCRESKSNAEIAKKLGWKVDVKSVDPFKRVRAAKSVARSRGLKIAGRLVRLHDSRLKGAQKAKTGAGKKAKSKAKAQPKAQQNAAPTAAATQTQQAPKKE